MKCNHDRESSRCKECAEAGTGGGSICDHGIVRSTCSICSDSVYKMYEYRARQRQIVFKLTLAQFREITSRPCFYCNNYGSPRGVDRRQNSQGYLTDNCVAACGWCNRTKSADSEETFLGHIWKVARHQEKLKAKIMEAA
jgi:hypothetical protein